MPGEEALWRYKRGAARARARPDGGRRWPICNVATGADAQPWVNGRARVELGRLALKRGDRAAAADEARQARDAVRARERSGVRSRTRGALLRSSNGR